jgi:hypothetical protein
MMISKHTFSSGVGPKASGDPGLADGMPGRSAGATLHAFAQPSE